MEKLVHKGLVRNIGLSNFNSHQIQDILDNGQVISFTKSMIALSINVFNFDGIVKSCYNTILDDFNCYLDQTCCKSSRSASLPKPTKTDHIL